MNGARQRCPVMFFAIDIAIPFCLSSARVVLFGFAGGGALIGNAPMGQQEPAAACDARSIDIAASR